MIFHNLGFIKKMIRQPLRKRVAVELSAELIVGRFLLDYSTRPIQL